MKTLRKLTVIAIGMVSAMLFTAQALAQPARAAQARNVVLVHGAWADGSSWSEVIVRLQAAGMHVTAVQNPLTSLADSVAAPTRGAPLRRSRRAMSADSAPRSHASPPPEGAR